MLRLLTAGLWFVYKLKIRVWPLFYRVCQIYTFSFSFITGLAGLIRFLSHFLIYLYYGIVGLVVQLLRIRAWALFHLHRQIYTRAFAFITGLISLNGFLSHFLIYLTLNRLRGLVVLDASDLEWSVKLLLEVLSCEGINTDDGVKSTESIDGLTRADFITSQVVVTDEAESGLVDIGSEGKLLSSRHLGEGIAVVVGVVDLTDLYGIISKVVLENEGKTLWLTEESEDITVVIEELLLTGNFATTECLFRVLFRLVVRGTGDFDEWLL